MNVGEMVSAALSAAVDGDDELAEDLHAADTAAVLGACGAPVTACEVRAAMRRRRDLRRLARRIGVPARRLRRWLRRGGELPIRVDDPPEIIRGKVDHGA